MAHRDDNHKLEYNHRRDNLKTNIIKINEVLLKDHDDWLHFSKPHQIITSNNLEDVIPALREIESLVERHGWHAAGFLSYEASSAFDKAHATKPAAEFPLIWFGLYPKPRIITLPEPVSTPQTLTWLPTTDRSTYNKAIERIREHIAQGQTYQVNYTMRLQSEFNIDPWDFFLQFTQYQNDHAAYIDLGRHVICSASPELFFQLDGGDIMSRPMKGTMSRGRTSLEDQHQAQALKGSEKNRAENVMIVDMIRNDLGRIAKIGSVQVPQLFTIEKYPSLWQMTSTVTAKTDASITEIFTALFPCASITGAPKVSTMQIISDLETTPRQIYTGSIGYIFPSRKANFNVAIRTALIDRKTKTAEYGVGGGIVWDSTSKDEYAEALLKALVLVQAMPTFSLLETMMWSPREGFFLREGHIARLLESADYFDFKILREQIENYLDQISSQLTHLQRVRLLLDRYGKLSYEAHSFQAQNDQSPLRAHLAKEPVHSGNIFLFHKTTHREVYEIARKDFPEYDDVLLYNENGELTEFTIGNLVAEIDGRFYTPPISCGLLAGTFREHLLKTGLIIERVIHMDEMEKCTNFFLVNSVRRWQNVILEPS